MALFMDDWMGGGGAVGGRGERLILLDNLTNLVPSHGPQYTQLKPTPDLLSMLNGTNPIAFLLHRVL